MDDSNRDSQPRNRFRERTYETVPGPKPEAFERYAQDVTSAFATLLASGPDERSIQRFLEQNPCLVPGPRSLGTDPSAHSRDSLLISQPLLPGLRSRRPDFMWITYTSAAIHPTLIEIERPNKRLFTSRGVPSAKFTQARHQLTQWKAWFSRPENVQKFIGDYQIIPVPGGEDFEPRFILICGRREEFENRPDLARERAKLLDGRIDSLVSYDRLSPDANLHNAITVIATGSGRFRAIAIPPTFTLGPRNAERLSYVDGIEDILRDSQTIANDRKEFLLNRLQYWREWTRSRCGIFTSSDCE